MGVILLLAFYLFALPSNIQFDILAYIFLGALFFIIMYYMGKIAKMSKNPRIGKPWF
jgi:hypothetical protein